MIYAVKDYAMSSLDFDDIRFTYSSEAHSNVIALFKSYVPACRGTENRANVSQYYIASNASYHAAKKLCLFLKNLGYFAEINFRLNQRQLALNTGGFIADNGLYFHDNLGSFVCIQTIVTDLSFKINFLKDKQKECVHCAKCEKMCPTMAISNGVTDFNKCMRNHLYHVMPEDMRKGVYQLFGCEICQMVCPHNETRGCNPISFDIKELLEGKHLEELVGFVGSNTARRNRVRSIAALLAGAKGIYETIPILDELSFSSSLPLSVHAKWAREQLKHSYLV